MMDILLGDDYEEEEDDDEEDIEGSDEIYGGMNEDKEEGDLIKEDITGMKLSNPNPIFKRMKDLEPTLFLTLPLGGKYSAYSRICPWNFRRQPVILNR